nr:hypothetical protein [Chromobacterium sp. ASV5]
MHKSQDQACPRLSIALFRVRKKQAGHWKTNGRTSWHTPPEIWLRGGADAGCLQNPLKKRDAFDQRLPLAKTFRHQTVKKLSNQGAAWPKWRESDSAPHHFGTLTCHQQW